MVIPVAQDIIGEASAQALERVWVPYPNPTVVWKEPVRLVTLSATTELALLGTIDGIDPEVDDRVLLKNGWTGYPNGIYVVIEPDEVGNILVAADDDLSFAGVTVTDGKTKVGTSWLHRGSGVWIPLNPNLL